jgi:nicotinic acid mononucleotide adenylyltransferase
MLNRAVRPHPRLSVAELVDISFSVKRTLPRLEALYPDAQMVFLWGSDAVAEIACWPDAAQLFDRTEFVITRRSRDSRRRLKSQIAGWQTQPRALFVFDSYAGGVSSRHIRDALRRRVPQDGLLTSVSRYANQHWLYVAFS